MDPLAGAAIRHGHRELLGTLGDFLRELDAIGFDGDADGVADETLRGAVAFLRQEMLPFARREEAWLREAGRPADGVAWEHAFLAAEVASLAAEAADLCASIVDERRAALARVRRRAHRIEAVLELHVLGAEEADDAESYVPSEEATPIASDDRRPHRGRSGAREMTSPEVRHFLAGRCWGLLATVGEAGPYAVPISYAWDGCAFYFATRPGRKADDLAAHPAVSLTVLDVRDGEEWRSVVATGTAAWVEGIPEKLRALNLLRLQRGTGVKVSAADVARIAAARVLRLEPAELSGRARGF